MKNTQNKPGRPLKEGERFHAVNFTLRESDVKYLELIGGGNRSAGLRTMIDSDIAAKRVKPA